jgi:hypothetical protein
VAPAPSESAPAAPAATASPRRHTNETTGQNQNPPSPKPAEATTKDEDVAKHAEAEAAVDDPTRWTCATCGGVKCGNKANYTAHVLSNKHKKAAQRERGRATLAALKAKAATAS